MKIMKNDKKGFVTSSADLIKGLFIGLILGIVFMYLNSRFGWIGFLVVSSATGVPVQ